MDLLIATTNKNKIIEIKNRFAGIKDLTLLGLGDVLPLGESFDVEETGTTFEENAGIKAKACGLRFGMPALADDSGLCVDALSGRPGIFSARYGENDKARISKLLGELQGAASRRAAFVCAIGIYLPAEDRLFTVIGECAGEIAESPAGINGFGYDPVFYLPNKGCTMAQLSLEEKNSISHRAAALTKAAPLLADIIRQSKSEEKR